MKREDALYTYEEYFEAGTDEDKKKTYEDKCLSISIN
jgi:hypothetical protein